MQLRPIDFRDLVLEQLGEWWFIFSYCQVNNLPTPCSLLADHIVMQTFFTMRSLLHSLCTCDTILLLYLTTISVPYCPEQASMGARSSSAKIWGWVVTRTKCLNGLTMPEQGPTPDAKLAAMGPNRLASSVRPCFVEASPTVEI